MIIELLLVPLFPLLIIGVTLVLELIERNLDRPGDRARTSDMKVSAASTRAEVGEGAAAEPATGFVAGQ